MKKLLCLLALLGLVLPIDAQDEKIKDLSLDELVAVDLDKSSLPIRGDSTKALSGNTINIGLILPLSTYQPFSEEVIFSAQMAVDEINASGKILGKELLLLTADDASDADFSVSKARELTSKYNAVGIVGPTISRNYVKIVREVLPEHPVVMISPATTSDEISALDDNDLAFRTIPSDVVQAEKAAFFCRTELSAKTAAILYIDDIYGRGVAGEFKKQFEASGGKVIAEEGYSELVNLTDYNLADRLRPMLEQKPDILYLATTSNGMIDISHQISKNELFRDYRPTLVASDGVRSGKVASEADLEIYEGIYCTALNATTSTSFEEKFASRYGRRSSSEKIADVYDIIHLIALAILEGQSVDPEQISRSLRSVSSSGLKVRAGDLEQIRKMIAKDTDIDYDGFNSTLEFDTHGDVTDRKFTVWQMRNGEFVEYGSK